MSVSHHLQGKHGWERIPEWSGGRNNLKKGLGKETFLNKFNHMPNLRAGVKHKKR